MKQTTFIAILLTFLMLLLVTIAAIVFLYQRNQELAEISEIQSSDQAQLVEMSEQMASDLVVRQAALESAEATREALSGQIEVDQRQINDLENELDQKETALNEAGDTLQDLAVQLFIFSPKEGAVVPPLEPLELFVAARSNSGVETIEITINGDILATYPSEGQQTSTVRTEWTPTEEGQYLISAKAQDGNSQTSETKSVTIQAAFSSPVARISALRRQTENDVRILRFPQVLETANITETVAQNSFDLHRQLLTGQENGVQEDYTKEIVVLQAFDLVPVEVNSNDIVNPAHDENILAFYDPESEILTIYQASDEPESFGRWVHVHDFAHQMLDENFQLNELDVTTLDGDARTALRALIEGESTFLQYLYLRGDYLADDQRLEIAEGLEAASTDLLNDLPTHLQDEFEFAYSDGLSFVKYLFDQDGYQGVNEAWPNLPESTEQILHPERYAGGDSPQPVRIRSLGETLEENWLPVDEDVFGEFLLRQHLGQQALTANQIDQAATGWGGGRYIVYQNVVDSEVMLLFRLAWDTPADSSEFTTTYADYLSQRYDGQGTALPGGGFCWEGEETTCLVTPAGETLVVRAPDLETATAVLASQ